MRVSRREILKTSAVASAGIVGVTNPVAAGDADPRAEPVAGEKPNTNVPTTHVGVLPGQDDPVPAGNWIHHSNGWISSTEQADGCELYDLLDDTTQVYTVAGEEFVFDSVDDWDFQDPDPDPETFCSAGFAYTTPPKPAGTTYEIRWEVFGDESEYPVIGAFPFVNEIEITRGRANGK